ncbi:MAG: hypothetical protein WC838_06735 [Candidatus Margulisiibacteriota bacterium]|jgi:hypothetical protein
MKNIIRSLVFISALLVIGAAGTAQAEIDINIKIGSPPVIVAGSPALVLIPQTGIYFVPGIVQNIFFYNEYWWTLKGDRWTWAKQYIGPWEAVQRKNVPAYLFKVPKNYREIYKKERPTNYGQWKKQHRHNR